MASPFVTQAKGTPPMWACANYRYDNTAKKYAKLHPAQYHGSAYGMAAAKRGHLKTRRMEHGKPP